MYNILAGWGQGSRLVSTPMVGWWLRFQRNELLNYIFSSFFRLPISCWDQSGPDPVLQIVKKESRWPDCRARPQEEDKITVGCVMPSCLSPILASNLPLHPQPLHPKCLISLKYANALLCLTVLYMLLSCPKSSSESRDLKRADQQWLK